MSQSKELMDWTYEQKCKKAVAALEKNGFTAIYCQSGKDVHDYIVKEAADAANIGFGGSMSVAELEVADQLRDQGKEILNHGQPGLSMEEKVATMRRSSPAICSLPGPMP